MSFWTLPFVPTSLRSLLQLSQTYRQRQSQRFASAQYLSRRANSGSRQAMKDHYVSSPSTKSENITVTWRLTVWATDPVSLRSSLVLLAANRDFR
jgi:hypothetical protein